MNISIINDLGKDIHEGTRKGGRLGKWIGENVEIREISRKEESCPNF